MTKAKETAPRRFTWTSTDLVIHKKKTDQPKPDPQPKTTAPKGG